MWQCNIQYTYTAYNIRSSSAHGTKQCPWHNMAVLTAHGSPQHAIYEVVSMAQSANAHTTW